MITVTADSATPTQLDECAANVNPSAPPSFERLVADHQPRVARLAQRLLGWKSDDVDDVVQEVFVSAWKALPQFRGDSSISTWLFRLTLNECRRQRRRRIMRLGFLKRFATHRPQIQESDPLDQDERLAIVRQAIARLPLKYRQIIVLRYLEELDVPEMMRVLNLSRSAIDVRLHRAREMLAHSLGKLVEP
jgi:RNA polymerase sigma-70 factor, ECF subfamily